MKYTKKQVVQSTNNLIMEVSEVREFRKILDYNSNYKNHNQFQNSLKDLCVAFGMKPTEDNLDLISIQVNKDQQNINRKLYLLNELHKHSFYIGSKIDVGILSLATLEKLNEIMNRKASQTDIDNKYYDTK